MVGRSRVPSSRLITLSRDTCAGRPFDYTRMGAAAQLAPVRVRPRDVLLVGAFVVGWSVGRAVTDVPGSQAAPPSPIEPVQIHASAPAVRRRRLRKPVRLALAGIAAATVVTAVGLATRPEVASAPLVSPAVVAQEHALAVKQHALAVKRAEAARITLLRRLELAGIAARRVGMPEPAAPRKLLSARRRPTVTVQPSERAIALDTFVQAVGTETILRGLDASRDQLQQQVLNDPRVQIYPAGRADVASGKLDVRVLAIIEYLAQADGEVSVSCLISGHSLYVAGRPGVVSAHIYGRAVDISAVANTPIVGHQGPGTITEHAIEQILALPVSVEPLQVISLMTLGGPSFALPDHYDHIHVGY
jgi:hypothetical protein